MNQLKSTQQQLLVLAVLVPAMLLAQWQVNRQVNRGGNAGPASGAVRYSNTYGYGNTIRNQSAGMMLPSQVRYATWTSGALPSESRMQARAVGPLSPSGSVAYIPPTVNYHAPKQYTTGNYLNTQVPAGGPTRPPAPVGPGGPVGVAGPAPLPSSSFTGSVQYSLPSPEVTPFSTIGSSSTLPIGQTLGSVKYTP